jgi:hypothetical protein
MDMAEQAPVRPSATMPATTLPAPAVVSRRLPGVAPRLLSALALTLVAAGQLAEDLSDREPLRGLSPSDALRRWTVIAAVFYMLGIARFVDGIVARSLRALSDVVDIDSARFAGYARRLGRMDVRTEATLLLVATVVVAAVFPLLGTSLPVDDPITNQPTHLPANGVEALVVLAGYTVLGWAMVTLVAGTLRRARALGELSREPLEVDVFDTTPLLPLGNIALATSLAPAGIIVILLVGFGRPSAPLSWALLLVVASTSLLALILPLRGIHRQMSTAKQHTLSRLNARLRELYVAAEADAQPLDQAEASRLNNRVGALVALRKTVGEMTTWPFRDTLAFGRAVLIASAPLIYACVTELIKIFWINPLAP